MVIHLFLYDGVFTSNHSVTDEGFGCINCVILYLFSRVDAFNPDLKKYPKFSKARAISFEQRPGELLIIPPGWFHQV